MYRCSQTARICMMTKHVMKSVTCDKDVSEHDRALQWEQWCQCEWQLDSVGCVLVDDSIQVWRPVVESAWHEHSSSPGCQPHAGWLSLPGPVWLEHLSLSIPCNILSYMALVYTHDNMMNFIVIKSVQ